MGAHLPVLLCVLLSICSSHSISCLDDEGNPVEWFVGYKFPDSYKYAYIQPGSNGWKVSDHSINKSGMLRRTFELMYSLRNSSDGIYGMYNDAKPQLHTVHDVWWGHMKGAFAFQLPATGFWIIHSIPKLSQKPDTYSFPESGHVYGQHFSCFSLNGSDLNKIVTQLIISRPLFQDTYVSSAIANEYPDLKLLLENKKVATNLSNVQHFASRNGSLQMLHFSKSVAYGKDLYASLVAPRLGFALNVETWRHAEEGGNEPSYCEAKHLWVLNIQSLQFRGLNISFPNFADHAKWATTIMPIDGGKSTKMWICLGDINRQFSQFRRGGGTMCIQSEAIWTVFNDLIVKRENCKTPPKSRVFGSYQSGSMETIVWDICYRRVSGTYSFVKNLIDYLFYTLEPVEISSPSSPPF
ncbi:unnamed protein product [Calicophoron daubneyi]|uniref:Uncharacterized protein n=1 Tax=Calicophoron daubneyi TaxID=300641 RepID=A0AAV2SX84_CALDB